LFGVKGDGPRKPLGRFPIVQDPFKLLVRGFVRQKEPWMMSEETWFPYIIYICN